MLTGYFNNIPRDRRLGQHRRPQHRRTVALHTVLPIAAPGIAVAAFFSFVVSWGDYLIVSIISQSQRTATVTLVLQRLSAALLVRWGQVAAAVVLTIVPTTSCFAFVQFAWPRSPAAQSRANKRNPILSLRSVFSTRNRHTPRFKVWYAEPDDILEAPIDGYASSTSCAATCLSRFRTATRSHSR